MNKQEFLEKWDKDTLLETHCIVGEKDYFPYSYNCYFEDGKWKIVDIGDRNDIGIICEGDEETVFTKLDRLVCSRQKTLRMIARMNERKKE